MKHLIVYLILVSVIVGGASSQTLSEADSALIEGNYDLAIQIYTFFLEEDSTSYAALFGLARAFAFSDKPGEAIQAFTDLLFLYPGDPDALLGRGRVYAWEHRFIGAEIDLTTVTKNYPEYGDAWSALGDMYLWSGEPVKALEMYSIWMAVDPDSPDPHMKRANAYVALRLFPQAREDLRIAGDRGIERKRIDSMIRSINRIPGATVWEGFMFYGFHAFTLDRPNWHTYSPSVKRDWNSGSIRFVVLRTSRFSKWDGSLAVDSYVDLRPRVYGNFYLQIASKPDFLPNRVFSTEIFHGVGEGWEISASYRNMRWNEKSVGIYGTSLAKYTGNYYLRGRFTVVPGEDFSISVSSFVRRYLKTVDDFIEIGLGRGDKIETFRQTSDWERSNLFMIIRSETFFLGSTGLVFSLAYNSKKNSPSSRILSLGIKQRW